MEVVVLNRQRARRVTSDDLAEFVHCLHGAMPPEGGADSLAIRLVSDRRMREYNRLFRGKDEPTDVLSFSGGADPEGQRHLGDIVISVSTAAVQARRMRHSLARELKTLALHGYLHLLGYDHEGDGGRMMQLQSRLIRRLLGAGKRRRGRS